MTSDTALLERPTVPNPVRPSRRWLPDVIGCVVVCLVILVGYHEVAFSNRTFSSSGQVRGSVLGGKECGHAIRRLRAGELRRPPGRPRRVGMATRAVGTAQSSGSGTTRGAAVELLGRGWPAAGGEHAERRLRPAPAGAASAPDAARAGPDLPRRAPADRSGRVPRRPAHRAPGAGGDRVREHLRPLGVVLRLQQQPVVPDVSLSRRSCSHSSSGRCARSGASRSCSSRFPSPGWFAIGMPEPTFMALFAGALYAVVRLFYGPRVHERWNALLRLAIGGALGARAGGAAAPAVQRVPAALTQHACRPRRQAARDRPRELSRQLDDAAHQSRGEQLLRGYPHVGGRGRGDPRVRRDSRAGPPSASTSVCRSR